MLLAIFMITRVIMLNCMQLLIIRFKTWQQTTRNSNRWMKTFVKYYERRTIIKYWA